jgi:hypothetical protein
MKLVLGVIALVAFGSIIHSLQGHSTTSSASNAVTSSVSSGSAGSARITMLRGPSSDNSCQENDGDARIYVVITLRNSGNAEGTVNPWATFDYSDGGNSTESYFDNYGHDLKVPAHTEVDATFYHTFNPQQHSMIRCAGYVDLGDSSGTGYYLPNKAPFS